jgi:hypothetical protein
VAGGKATRWEDATLAEHGAMPAFDGAGADRNRRADVRQHDRNGYLFGEYGVPVSIEFQFRILRRSGA